MYKYFRESIMKTINNFDKLDEEVVIQSLEGHELDFMMKEEQMTIGEGIKAAKLWNLLIQKTQEKYPHLIG